MFRVRRCQLCGSSRLRRARSHRPWQRMVRALTPLERYACGDCQHRGWRLPVDEAKPDQADLGLTSRRVEARDVRMAAAVRRMLVRGVLLAVVLGALLALMLAGL